MVRIADILHGGHTGRELELKGWIYRTRSVGGKVFVVLRDDTGILQATISKDAVPADAFAAIAKALIESAVTVRGTVVEDKRAPGGFEIRATGVLVVHFAEKFPIQEDLSEELLLDVRHLWVRSQRMTRIFRVRHVVCIHTSLERDRRQPVWHLQRPSWPLQMKDRLPESTGSKNR